MAGRYVKTQMRPLATLGSALDIKMPHRGTFVHSEMVVGSAARLIGDLHIFVAV